MDTSRGSLYAKNRIKKTKTAICSRCKEEYIYSKTTGLKYDSCRRCTKYLCGLKRRKDAKGKHLCITCFKRKAKEISCPHCKKAIIYSLRCSKCMKDNGRWALSKLSQKIGGGKNDNSI